MITVLFWSTNYEQAMTSEQVRYRNFGTNFAATRFRHKISEKIAWHEPSYMLTSSATSLIVIRRFFIIIFFTASVFSLVVDVLGRPGRASSFISS